MPSGSTGLGPVAARHIVAASAPSVAKGLGTWGRDLVVTELCVSDLLCTLSVVDWAAWVVARRLRFLNLCAVKGAVLVEGW